MDKLVKDLEQTRLNLNSQVNNDIKKIIRRFDKQNQWVMAFWYWGSGIKARCIEAAMAKVPIMEREKLLTSKNSTITGVLAALASHRIQYTNPINAEKKIVVEKSAETFKTFREKYKNDIDGRTDVSLPKNKAP